MSTLVSRHSLEKEQLETLGQEEFDKRCQLADKYGEEIAADQSWFSEEKEENRWFIPSFMSGRIRQLALAINAENFKKLEEMGHDKAGCIILKMMENGRMI